MNEKSPLLRLWELGNSEHTPLKKSIFLAVIGVLFGMLPYFAAAQIIIGLMKDRHDYKFYVLGAIVAIGGYLLRALLYALALSVSHKATFSVLKSIRESILEKLPKVPLGTIIDTSSGEMKQIIVDQVESMERPLAHLLPEMIANILGPVCILIYLFILDWRMAVLSIISIPLGSIFMGFVMKNYTAEYEGSVKTNSEMNVAIVEYISGIEVIKAFNQGKQSYAKFSEKIKANASYFYHWMKSCQFFVSLSKSIVPTTLITILPVGFLLYQKGSLGVDVFITTIILSLGIAGPIIAAMNFVDSLAKVGTIVGSIDVILKSEEQQHGKEKVELPDASIYMDNVSFGYHEDKEILHQVSLQIPSGSLNAFVGPSGSGKSTIAKLIAGFWDIKQGHIKIGGIDIKDIPLSQLYSEVSFVSQDNYLFDETILENIRMGDTNASDEDVIRVSIASGCDDFIRKLDQGYNTVAGSKGTHLSGGERQRISIARAMLKDAPIIIFDEATAYIDPENEAIIQRAVGNLIKDKTVIIIAHRLSTVIDADQIFLISDGIVDDYGKHDELLQRNFLYKTMWQAHIGVKDGDEL
ncbi:ABC transporter ATP-binding protein [Clostridium sp.]|uniref:ABC transporter ATP-binding protein n=1 Tax=Clostridium sp. TaxID=1506 RepID=UPI0035A0A6DA